MKRFQKIISVVIIIAGFVFSCSSDEHTALVEVDPPTPVNLLFPSNNSECNEGIIVSDTETDVLFQWEEATNASAYILQVNNLKDGSTRIINTLSTEFLLRILRGTPYSWSVKSKVSGSNETAESEIWKFYNVGFPEESHPPFPAEAVNPVSGSNIEEGSVTLQWQASDVDDDISSYTVFLDTKNPPTNEVGETTSNSLSVSVESGLIYYWKVITKDEIGNTSDSPTFQFSVN